MPDSSSGNPSHSRVELKEKLLDGSKGAVHLAVVALKVAVSAAQNVPYLGAISTVLEEVMKIIDEIDVCKATWTAVMVEIQAVHMLVDTFRTQWTGKGMNEKDLPAPIKKAFSEFEICLLKVIVTMNNCKTKSKSVADRIRLLAKRSEITATANQCAKHVVSSLRMFQATLQIDQWNRQIDQQNLQMDQSKSMNDLTRAVMPHAPLIANLNSTIPISMLPPAPFILYGRSGEVQDVVDLIVNCESTCVAIIGFGGIGRTSIALTAIHHTDVEKAFLHQRLFLSCEAIFTADTLVLELLKLFGLSVESSGSRSPSDTLRLCLQSMTSKCLLCLDNFETPWDSDKDAVESVLTGIAARHLTLVITSRDLDHPRGIKWAALKPIQPLTLEAAVETWDAISHTHNNFSLQLIKAVECIPLAVTLLAQLAEVESSETLWARWNSEWTRLVKSDGSAHRLNNLELSIELSLHSRRLHACPGATDFFVILCMLPQGLPESRIPDLQTAFGTEFTEVRSAITVLKQCSLAYTLDGFLHVLSPIRQYMQSHPNLSTALSKVLFTQMANHYLDLIPVDNSHINSSVACEAIRLEIGNISAVLDLCLTEDMDLHRVLRCIIWFSRVCCYLDVYGTRLLSKAASIAHDFSHSLEGDCYFEQGTIYLRINNLSDAEDMLKAALTIHSGIDNGVARATDLWALGKLYQRLSRLKDAEKSLQSALDLHREVNNRLGQANDLRALGRLYQRFNRLEDAEKSLQSALDLHREVNNRLGQANDLQALGGLYLTLNRLEDAKTSLQSALDLHREVNNRLGQANDLQALGGLYLTLNQLEDAEQALQSALDFHREANDKLGQANDLRARGRLYQRLNQLEDAEKSLQSALNLHREVNDRLGQANDLRALGRLYQTLDRLQDAEKSLQSALNLHRELNNRTGQAKALWGLGELYMKLDQMDDAEQALQSALNIYTELASSLGQGNALQSLGELYTSQCRYSEAEEFLGRAIDAYRWAHEPRGQQYTQKLLESLQKKWDEQEDGGEREN